MVGDGGNAVVACEPSVTKVRFDSLAFIAAIGSFRPMEFELLYVASAHALGRFVGLDNVDIKKRGLAAFFLFNLRFRPKLFLVFAHFLLH